MVLVVCFALGVLVGWLLGGKMLLLVQEGWFWLGLGLGWWCSNGRRGVTGVY